MVVIMMILRVVFRIRNQPMFGGTAHAPTRLCLSPKAYIYLNQTTFTRVINPCTLRVVWLGAGNLHLFRLSTSQQINTVYIRLLLIEV